MKHFSFTAFMTCILINLPVQSYPVSLLMVLSEKHDKNTDEWHVVCFAVHQPLTCKSLSWHCFSSTSVRSLSSSTVFCSCSFSSSMAFTRRSSSCLRSDNIFICPTRPGKTPGYGHYHHYPALVSDSELFRPKHLQTLKLMLTIYLSLSQEKVKCGSVD